MSLFSSKSNPAKISARALLILALVGSVFLNTVYYQLKPGIVSADSSASGFANKVGKTFSDLVVIDLSEQLNNKHSGTLQIWSVMLGIANGAVALFFIVIALATIFNIQIDTYGVKKSLVPIIIGIILANLSLPIIKMLLDISNAISGNIISSVGEGEKDFLLSFADKIFRTFWRGGIDSIQTVITSNGWNAVVVAIGGVTAIGFIGALLSGGVLGGVVLAMFLFAIYILIPVVLLLVIAFLLYIRTIMIMLLTAVSPIAFLTAAWGPTQGLFRKWWGAFLNWAFMAAATLLVLWFAVLFGNSFQNQANLATYLTTVALMYIATQVPFKMGGAIMGAWGAVGKKIGGMIGKGAWNQSNSLLESAAKNETLRGLGITSPRAMLKGFSEERQLNLQQRIEEASLTARGAAMERSQHGLLGGIYSSARANFSAGGRRRISQLGQAGTRFSAQQRYAQQASGLEDEALEREAMGTRDSDQASAYISELANNRGFALDKLKDLVRGFKARFSDPRHDSARQQLSRALARNHASLAIDLDPSAVRNNPSAYLRASEEFWTNMNSAVARGSVGDPNLSSKISPELLESVLSTENINLIKDGSADSSGARGILAALQSNNEEKITDNLLKLIRTSGRSMSKAEEEQMRERIRSTVERAKAAAQETAEPATSSADEATPEEQGE